MSAVPVHEPITAVLWDFGGVILTSPFDAFADYERGAGLPVGTIRIINSTNPDSNAWARLERSEVDVEGFASLFAQEGRSLGFEVDGKRLLGLLNGEVRPKMVEALRTCKAAGFKLGCLTNNVNGGASSPRDTERERRVDEAMALFDHVTESRHTGIRKPEIRFYELACEAMDIRPTQAVFLDDLGINLKPAAALGMRTIKVVDPDDALQQLSALINVSFA